MPGNIYLNRGICKQLGDKPAAIFGLMLNRQADGFDPSDCCAGGQVIELQEQEYFPYSKTDLSRELSMSISTINRHIKKLIEAGLIEEVKRKGEPCFYRMVERGEWTAWLYKQRRRNMYLIK